MAVVIDDLIYAIELEYVIEFDYGGYMRMVEPFVVGRSSFGDELLQGYQIAGGSQGGRIPAMKLFRVDRIEHLEITVEPIFEGFEEYDESNPWMSEVISQM